MSTVFDLDTFRTQALALLDEATGPAGSPLQTLVLATLAGTTPEARVLILREWAPALRRLTAFGDARAAKTAQLRAQPRVCWTGWHPTAQVQLRLYGQVALHQQDTRARAAWDSMPTTSRLHYSGNLPAGTPLAAPEDAQFAPFGRHDAPESQAWFRHFCVIDTTLDTLDLLQLDRSGHRRARYQWDGTRWAGQWVMP